MKLKIKYYNLLIINIIRIIILVLVIITFSNYLLYRKVINTHKNIKYEVVEVEEHSGGRGAYYSYTVYYLNKKYTLNITSKVFKNIQNKNYPNLYYVYAKDKIISEWQMIVSKRLFILFIVCLIISFIPISKVYKSYN